MSSNLFNSGIRPIIDNHLDELSKEVRDYGDYWSASSAGYCQRLVIMRRLGVPPVPEIADDKARTQRVFSVGHIFHEWIQKLTRNAGISIAQEVELQDEDLMIRGHFDDLVLIKGKMPEGDFSAAGEYGFHHSPTPDEDTLILYDYKTAHSNSFNYKKIRNEIGYYHKMQLGTYMYMLRKQAWVSSPPNQALGEHTLVKDLTEARILTISKDDLRMHEDQLMWSEELEEAVKSYWKSLNKAWADKKLPPCTCLDHDGGWLGKRTAKGKIYNDYYYNDIPCSIEWYDKCKKEGLLK